MHFRPLLVNLAACFNCYDRGIGYSEICKFRCCTFSTNFFFNNFLRNSSAQHTEDTCKTSLRFLFFRPEKNNCYKKIKIAGTKIEIAE